MTDKKNKIFGEKTLKEIEHQLNLEGETISAVESWWSITITKQVSRYQGLVKKLQSIFGKSLSIS